MGIHKKIIAVKDSSEAFWTFHINTHLKQHFSNPVSELRRLFTILEKKETHFLKQHLPSDTIRSLAKSIILDKLSQYPFEEFPPPITGNDLDLNLQALIGTPPKQN